MVVAKANAVCEMFATTTLKKAWYCVQMVELLLQKGADPKLCDSDGQSAREYAAISGHTKVLDLPESLTKAWALSDDSRLIE